MMSRIKKFTFISLTIIASYLIWIYIQVRQSELNRDLLEDIIRNDVAAAKKDLRKGANPNACVSSDNTGFWECLRNLIRYHRHTQPLLECEPLFMKAVSWLSGPPYYDNDNPDMIEALIASGASINNSSNGGTALIKAIVLRKRKTIKVLLDHNANVNGYDKTGQTALMYAVEGSDITLIESLIIKGAQVNARNHFGETALCIALDPRPGNDDLIRERVACLLKYGAKTADIKKYGTSASDYASMHSKDKLLIRMLKKHKQ
jgi:ankyrin repeat protein